MNANASELAWQMLESASHQQIATRDTDVRVDAGILLHSLDT